MVKLPEFRKAISKFLTSEDGRISKKAIIGVGALVALASFAYKARGGCDNKFHITKPWVRDSLPENFKLATNICKGEVHSSGHDDSGGCERRLDAQCKDVTHKNNLEIKPQASALIATHTHSVDLLSAHAKGYWDA